MSFEITVTLVGIFVVFMALVLLSLIIYTASKILNIRRKAPKIESYTDKDRAPILKVSGDERTDAPDGSPSDEELIAVLTAAALAGLRRSSECKIRVKHFRRIPQTSPPWNLRGRNEYISDKL